MGGRLGDGVGEASGAVGGGVWAVRKERGRAQSARAAFRGWSFTGKSISGEERDLRARIREGEEGGEACGVLTITSLWGKVN
jgi:hypothetical protein